MTIIIFSHQKNYIIIILGKNMEHVYLSYTKDVKEIKGKVRIAAENFFALILILKTLSFVKAVALYLGI